MRHQQGGQFIPGAQAEYKIGQVVLIARRPPRRTAELAVVAVDTVNHGFVHASL
jgi:hypothetical protein